MRLWQHRYKSARHPSIVLRIHYSTKVLSRQELTWALSISLQLRVLFVDIPAGWKGRGASWSHMNPRLDACWNETVPQGDNDYNKNKLLTQGTKHAWSRTIKSPEPYWHNLISGMGWAIFLSRIQWPMDEDHQFFSQEFHLSQSSDGSIQRNWCAEWDIHLRTLSSYKSWVPYNHVWVCAPESALEFMAA